MDIDLSAAPFNLDAAAMAWVEGTRDAMSVDQKIGQVLCTSVASFGRKSVRRLAEEIQVGGVMFRPLASGKVRSAAKDLQSASAVPLLLAANLESGGEGIATDGTYFATPGGVAATGDAEQAYRLGAIACGEAAAVGVNWAFAPIVDIDMNYRNPITNVRAFGSDASMVKAMGGRYLDAARERGVAATIKHFPGDGVDERDQHLLVSVNDLDASAWWDSFGDVYSTLISAGAPSIMIGHIAQPAVARDVRPGISDAEALAPASLSEPLLSGLLRERLGFNGLVITDSTLMVGFMQTMPRREALPLAIERGCDMILFNRNLEEDFRYLSDGVREGILSTRRLDEAVTRVLALKASLGLHERQKQGALVPDDAPVGTSQAREWAVECADRAVTLVKDSRGVLPLDVGTRKRVYLNVIENYADNKSPFAKDIKERLEREGFDVTLRRRKLDFNPARAMKGGFTPAMLRVLREVMASTDDFVQRYDMAMIVLNMETVSNATVVRVDWKVMFGLGNDIPWYAGEMPLVVVSTANPYHLLDVPMAHAYVNAYSNNPATLDAVFDKLMGRSQFVGSSPVDAFCGHEDCAL